MVPGSNPARSHPPVVLLKIWASMKLSSNLKAHKTFYRTNLTANHPFIEVNKLDHPSELTAMWWLRFVHVTGAQAFEMSITLELDKWETDQKKKPQCTLSPPFPFQAGGLLDPMEDGDTRFGCTEMRPAALCLPSWRTKRRDWMKKKEVLESWKSYYFSLD